MFETFEGKLGTYIKGYKEDSSHLLELFDLSDQSRNDYRYTRLIHIFCFVYSTQTRAFKNEYRQSVRKIYFIFVFI